MPPLYPSPASGGGDAPSARPQYLSSTNEYHHLSSTNEYHRTARGAGMSEITIRMIRSRPVAAAAIAIAAVGAATILGAWFFQYALGLRPCPLCLEQRYAYYFAIPLAVVAARAAAMEWQRLRSRNF